MIDRVPRYPGRVLITPESGSAYYATIERADQPTQAGTPLNKATLLSDATADLLKLAADDPTVNEALAKLASSKTGLVSGTYTGTYTRSNTSQYRLIELDFTPSLVIIGTKSYAVISIKMENFTCGGAFGQSGTILSEEYGCTENGFYTCCGAYSYAHGCDDYLGNVYHYVAFE